MQKVEFQKRKIRKKKIANEIGKSFAVGNSFLEKYEKMVLKKTLDFKKWKKEIEKTQATNVANRIFASIDSCFRRNGIFKKKNLRTSFALISILSILIGTYFQFVPASQGYNYIWNQTSWDTLSSDNATHPGDRTSWTKYSAADSDIDTGTAGQISLDTTTLSRTLTANEDFKNGTFSSTEIDGSSSASVKLSSSSIKQISTFSSSNCILKTDGTVWCWGYNYRGELGDGIASGRSMPYQVTDVGGTGNISGVKQITTGYDHACALKTDGTVWCWGVNYYGRLGNTGVSVYTASPVQVMGEGGVGNLADVSYVSAGGYHTCAIKTDGSVWCWGQNSDGELGTNTITNSYTPAKVLGPGGVGYLENVHKIATGIHETCALKTDGTVWCWGDNYYGELGDNTLVQRRTPVQVLAGESGTGNLSDVKEIAAGNGYRTCAIKTDGYAYCWGYAGSGVLGDGTQTNRYTPVKVHGPGDDANGLTDVKQVSIGANVTCGTKTDGSAYCWGFGGSGNLGDGSATGKYYPVQVVGVGGTGTLSDVTNVQAGYQHSCALTNSGSIYCWGTSSYWIGDNVSTFSATPVQVLKGGTLTNFANASQSDAGDSFTCTVKTDGTVWCWGSTIYGQTGSGPGSNTYLATAHQVVGVGGTGFLSGISQVSTGSYGACAVKSSDGSVYCWGSNGSGQLGDGSTNQRNIPVQVKIDASNYLTGVAKVSLGDTHTCALKSDGTVYCWGSNNYGQLGNNGTSSSSYPVQVLADASNPFTGVSDISTGNAETCALKTDGTVYCWGRNNYGQLGVNTSDTSAHSLPVQVLGTDGTGTLSGISMIDLGYYTACALKSSDGSVYCWGYGGVGQLSPGGDKHVPYQILGVGGTGTLQGISEIKTSNTFICAKKSDGSEMYCWGYNNHNQIGDGTTTARPYPVKVAGGEAGGTYLSNISSISTGLYSDSACAIKTDGSLLCWGINSSFDLADNTSVTKRATPVYAGKTIPSDGNFDAGTSAYNSSGTFTSEAIDLGRKSSFTTLSFNSTTPANTTLTIDVRAGNTAAPDGTWTDWSTNVSTGGSISNLNGNQYIQYRANLSTTDTASTPSLDDLTINYKYQSSTDSSIVQSDEGVTNTGFNLSGAAFSQTAVSGTGASASVKLGTTSLNASTISAGNTHACAASEDGTVWCWGYNDYGQLGDGTTSWPTYAKRVLKGLAKGGDYVTVGGTDYLSNIKSISTGYSATCALSNAGNVYCWGYNVNGQLGDGTTTNRSTPVMVAAGAAAEGDYSNFNNNNYLSNIASISIKSFSNQNRESACAVSNAGNIYCWGNNYYGQLGNGSTSTSASASSSPVRVVKGGASGSSDSDGTYLINIKSVSAGAFDTCAVANSGSVYCWGYNGYGELGRGNTTDSSSPVRVLKGGAQSGDYTNIGGTDYLSNIESVSVSNAGSDVCAVANSGYLYCWGRNNQGQEGDNSTTQRTSPVQVLKGSAQSGDYTNIGGTDYLSNIKSVSASYASSCAISDNNNIYCWGNDSNGQLGNNDTADVYVPNLVLKGGAQSGDYTNISGTDYLSNAKTVAVGTKFACTVSNNNNAYCWGLDDKRQLGDGSTSDSHIPVQVKDTAGTGNMALAATATYYYSSGTYTSGVIDLGQSSNFSTISYTTTVSDRTAVIVDARAGDSTDTDDESWTDWKTNVASGGNIYDFDSHRYVQYKATLVSSDPTVSPSLDSVTINYGYYISSGTSNINFTTEGDYVQEDATNGTDFGSGKVTLHNAPPYPTAQPHYVTTSDASQINTSTYDHISSVTLTQTTPDNTSIKYLVSFDDRATWKYWDGDSWETSTLDDLQTNGMSKGTLEGLSQANWESAGGFYSGNTTLDFAADLSTTDSAATPELDNIQINYVPLPASLTSSAYNTSSIEGGVYQLGWTESLPDSSTDVKFQVRTAPNNGGTPGTWTDWMGTGGTSATYFTNPNGTESMTSEISDKSNDQWIQYRVFLSSTNTAYVPTLSDLNLTYKINEAPEVQNVTASQGSDGIVTVDYEVKDIDANTGMTPNKVNITLQYCTANCSSAGSETWANATTVAGDGSDTSFPAVSVQQDSWTSHSLSWTAKTDYPTQYNNTNFKVRVKADDSGLAQNLAYGTSSSFTIDTTNPTGLSFTINNVDKQITLATPFDNSHYTMAVSHTPNVFSSSSFVEFSSPYDYSGMGNDPVTIYLRVKDDYGNYSDLSVQAPAKPETITYYDISDLQSSEYREFIAWGPIPAGQVGAGFDHYNVMRKTDSGTWENIKEITDRTINYYADKTVTSGHTYYYKINAEDTAGNISDYSSVVSDEPDGHGSTDQTPPNITDVAVSSVNTTSARVSWTTDELSDSSVGYSEDTTYLPELGNASLVTTHSVFLTGLHPDTTYHIRVKSRDVIGNLGQVDGDSPGDNSSAVFELKTHPGPAIYNVTIPNISNNQATITWKTTTDSSTYVDYWKLDENGDPEDPIHESGTPELVGGSSPYSHNQIITGLTEGTKYYFYVKSIDRSGNIATDNNGGENYEFTTTMDTEPPIMTGIEAAIASDTQAAIHWVTDEPSTSQVKYSKTSGGSYTDTTEIELMDESHYVILSNLDPDRTYYYKVISHDINGNSATSAEKSFDTLKDPEYRHPDLSEITDVTTPVITDTKAVVTFNTDQAALCLIQSGTASGNYTNDVSKEDGYDDDTNFNVHHSIHINGLIFSTRYYYQITCRDNLDNAVSSTEYNFLTATEGTGEERDTSAPSISGISAGTITGESATITWTTDEKASSLIRYGITTDYGNMAGNDLVNSDIENYVTDHSVIVNNLTPGTQYYYTVVSVDASGNIGESGEQNLTTKSPSTLSSIKIVSNSLSEVTITWTTSKDLTSEVEYGETADYGSSKTDNSASTDHSVSLSGLKAATIYHFRVKGKDSDNNYYSSGDYTFEPKSPPKVSASNVSSITEHGAKLVVTTDIPTDILITYIDKNNPENTGSQGKPDLATSHEIDLANLNAGTTYSYTVRVADEQGNQTTGEAKEFTTSKDETAPVIDQVKNDSALTQNDKVQTIISWMTDEPATTSITFREGISGEEKTIDSSSAYTGNHIIVITTFKPGTVYYFKTKSVDQAGNETITQDFALLTPRKKENVVQMIINNFTDIFGWAKLN